MTDSPHARESGPGKGRSSDTTTKQVWPQNNPRLLVETMTPAELATVVSTVATSFGTHLMIEDDGRRLWWRCPICCPNFTVYPQAHWFSEHGWECNACKSRGTRFTLERIVLEDPELVATALELLAVTL